MSLTYQDVLDGLGRYGSSEAETVRASLGIDPALVRPNVVLAPWWTPEQLPGLGEATLLTTHPAAMVKVWSIDGGPVPLTYIRTGIGAPLVVDTVLALGLTGCQRLVFTGSVGSLDATIKVGDIVVPQSSMCGDGASRYVLTDDLTNDHFGQLVFPDAGLRQRAEAATQAACADNGVTWHSARVYSTDTIIAQFAHLDQIIALGCDTIEMETAAAFAAGRLMGLPVVAVLSVSDNAVQRQTLMNTQLSSNDSLRATRKALFPQIIGATLAD